MKINELFEAKYSSGAYHKPSYSTYDGGKIRGSVIDWLKAMGVSTDDVQTAYKEVKLTPEYKAILDLGFSDESNDREIKNGTLNFIKNDYYQLSGYGPNKIQRVRLRYKVLANGKIDVVSPNDWNRYDLPSPKPLIIKDNPVQTVVRTMTNSLKRLHEILSKRLDKANKQIKKMRENNAGS